jgi:thioredoxin-like negative regulator of GroEL
MVADPIDRQRLMALYQQRLDADPASRVFLPLAELLRRDGRHAEARLLLEAGRQRHPGFISALVALSQVLLDLGDETGAREILDQVATRDPDNLVALRLQAAAAANRDDWPAAVAHLERIARLDPGDVVAIDRLQAARESLAATVPAAAVQEASTEAATATEATAEAAGGVITLTLADLYLRQGYTERARELLTAIAAAHPDREDVRERIRRLDHAEATPGPPDQPLLRRRMTGERTGERQRFESWLERAGED